MEQLKINTQWNEKFSFFFKTLMGFWHYCWNGDDYGGGGYAQNNFFSYNVDYNIIGNVLLALLKLKQSIR